MIPDTASLWAGVRRYEDILNRDSQAYSFAPLVDLYLSLGLLDDALRTARKGCAIHPDFAAGQMALARAALESSLKADAKSALEAVVRITPENLEAQRLLADIYTADNEQSAAVRCLNIVHSLEVLPEPAMAATGVSPEQVVEELADDDILELTDDLIESESGEDTASSPFSASPARPSLGDASLRAEPFLMESPPPLFAQEEAAISPPLPVEREGAETTAVASATIAELYVSQGFPEKGAETYRVLLQGEPDNAVWKQRLAVLTAPAVDSERTDTLVAVAAAKADTTEGVLEALCGWLANIGRIRECRTKIT